MDRHKLGIIIPYRNRYKQLEKFKKEIVKYLNKTDIKYEIIIIEQDDAKLFNRGMLLNIGYTYAISLKCDYIVFHDIDMLPHKVDYSYSDKPLHMATNFIYGSKEKKREIFDEYFGGVTMFPIEVFEKINGYSNKYWGWGYEDTDILLRCSKSDVELDTLKLKNIGKNKQVIKFNGINSMVKIKNNIDFNSNATFSITFKPENLILNHEKDSDDFTIFSIPGWDFAICYNSFSRYNFCAFDSEKIPFFINTKIKKNYRTNITITMNRNEKYFSLFQDGVYIGSTNKFKKLYPYKKEKYFYLGVGKPERESIPNFFNGTFHSFAYFDEILENEEIKEISTNNKSLLNDFGDYKSSRFLKGYYDSENIEDYKLVDLSGDNHGEIFDCEISDEYLDEYKIVKIPYRRHSTFKSLKHEENGFLGNKWKDQSTRWNQLRFHNEVFLNDDLLKNDGLSDLKFVEHGKTYENKILHINVGI
jgi:hypothetical protein